jgi:hypothetical protein
MPLLEMLASKMLGLRTAVRGYDETRQVGCTCAVIGWALVEEALPSRASTASTASCVVVKTFSFAGPPLEYIRYCYWSAIVGVTSFPCTASNYHI